MKVLFRKYNSNDQDTKLIVVVELALRKWEVVNFKQTDNKKGIIVLAVVGDSA